MTITLSRLLVLVLTMLASLSTAAHAQRLAAALSSITVSVDSSFAGETLTFFGNIEPEIGSGVPVEGNDYNIVILVQGPAINRVVRRKTGDLGLWLNTEQRVYEGFPSYFWLLTSSPLGDIADNSLFDAEGLLPSSQPLLVPSTGNGDLASLSQELVRLMEESDLYGVHDHGVIFRSRTLYSASLSLPANVPNGNFTAKTFLFRAGALVAQNTQSFSVRKTGFERLVGSSAKSMPIVYGFICVLLAVFTGWLGGVIFKR